MVGVRVGRQEYTSIFATDEDETAGTSRTPSCLAVAHHYCLGEPVGTRWYSSSRCRLLLTITVASTVAVLLFLVLIMGIGYPIGLLAEFLMGREVRLDLTSVYLAASDGMGVIVVSVFAVVGIALLVMRCAECCRNCSRTYRDYRDGLATTMPIQDV
jgi:hypothetical protein